MRGGPLRAEAGAREASLSVDRPPSRRTGRGAARPGSPRWPWAMGLAGIVIGFVAATLFLLLKPGHAVVQRPAPPPALVLDPPSAPAPAAAPVRENGKAPSRTPSERRRRSQPAGTPVF
jgi:hypothetical protein